MTGKIINYQIAFILKYILERLKSEKTHYLCSVIFTPFSKKVSAFTLKKLRWIKSLEKKSKFWLIFFSRNLHQWLQIVDQYWWLKFNSQLKNHTVNFYSLVVINSDKSLSSIVLKWFSCAKSIYLYRYCFFIQTGIKFVNDRLYFARKTYC